MSETKRSLPDYCYECGSTYLSDCSRCNPKTMYCGDAIHAVRCLVCRQTINLVEEWNGVYCGCGIKYVRSRYGS